MTVPAHCRECQGPVEDGRLYCEACGCQEPGCQRSARSSESRRCGFHAGRRAVPRVQLQVHCQRCGRPAIIRGGMPSVCWGCGRGSLAGATPLAES